MISECQMQFRTNEGISGMFQWRQKTSIKLSLVYIKITPEGKSEDYVFLKLKFLRLIIILGVSVIIFFPPVLWMNNSFI